MYTVKDGKPLPFGSEPNIHGTNFSLFSRNGTGVTLCIFDKSTDSEPVFSYRLDPKLNRTGDIWHCFLEGAKPGTLYLYKIDGLYLPEKGFRFNEHKALIDPYAKALSGDYIWKIQNAFSYNTQSQDKDLSFDSEDTAHLIPKCIVIDDDSFNWENDRPLNYPLRFSVLYETHIIGLSKLAKVEHPGTYLGVIEMIPYLKKLGITSLEFLPIQEFDQLENTRKNPKTGTQLENYWGYSTLAFFAPKSSYASSSCIGEQVTEFKHMVKELHKNGIEVILDIVFNHTAEGNELGPTISFRGIDNQIYYMLDDDKRYYKNYSGCGNTLNCNHPVMRTLILDCLRYWVIDMHIDGFRFDLGSILGRDQNGRLMENPPILERIAEDPILRNTKIIAEAWDAGGAYQVGWFPGGRWAEWNDRYRDDIRKFWRGDDFSIQGLATRLSGSSDLYLRDGRKPFHSINFITSHDGFTINDLVSFNGKHNDQNGENNNDGNDSNFSFNYGFEGSVVNPNIERTRNKQIKNFFATLLLSLGTPMLLGGDEIRRTQKGNNNAYCQNNELSWYNWNNLNTHKDMFRFVSMLIQFRLKHPAFLRPEFYTGKDHSYNAIPDITWFDNKGDIPDWSKNLKLIAVRINGCKADSWADRDDNDFYMIFNANTEFVQFTIPDALGGKKWYRVVDTSKNEPDDFLEQGYEEKLFPQSDYLVSGQSFVLLLSK